MSGRKRLTIHLNYWKQGDDLDRCIVKNDDDSINTKKSIENHISLLESVISHLKDINDKIPEVNICELYGDTHYISIEGDERIMNELVSNKLAYEDPFDDEEETTNEDEDNDYNSNDSNKDNADENGEEENNNSNNNSNNNFNDHFNLQL